MLSWKLSPEILEKKPQFMPDFKKQHGDFITVIDADLQQRPETVARMVKILQDNEEFDCVAAYQEKRQEGKLVSKLKDMFYKIINGTSEIEFFPGASDFRTFRRPVVDAVLSLPEYHRSFLRGFFQVGFNTCYIPYTTEKRNAGETKWSINKLFRYAVEGFISYTTFPLKIATGLGLFTSLCAIIYLFVVVIQKLCIGNPVPGYPTIVVLILLLGGIQLYDPWNYWRISCKNVYTGRSTDQSISRRNCWIIKRTRAKQKKKTGKKKEYTLGKRVLIIGGAGFIGTNLSEHLIKE